MITDITFYLLFILMIIALIVEHIRFIIMYNTMFRIWKRAREMGYEDILNLLRWLK